MTRNYYQILNISTFATQEEIKHAYRNMARKYHPDMNKDYDTTSLMQEITEAYEVLSDINKRRTYDAKINNQFQSKKVYESYTKTREESEVDFDDWINNYLKRQRKNSHFRVENEKDELKKLKTAIKHGHIPIDLIIEQELFKEKKHSR